jgi:hypothetical protein
MRRQASACALSAPTRRENHPLVDSPAPASFRGMLIGASRERRRSRQNIIGDLSPT